MLICGLVKATLKCLNDFAVFFIALQNIAKNVNAVLVLTKILYESLRKNRLSFKIEFLLPISEFLIPYPSKDFNLSPNI